ncbi:hypothetical protein CC78DRAFT_609331 [Lojkania enalia]|uniref:Uncharacterized protein n=1 Tax=Lojkania enalia TaxID=147567 RepID=A0A9P4N8B0_9PLEO|nr:hypothetical protein CC78DRAFT_609331 [Didymosphaeria enalia]
MSTSRTAVNDYQHITPSSGFVDPPLTPPLNDGKPSTQAPQTITLFKDIEAGRLIKQPSRTVFQLAPGEYYEIERRIVQDEVLYGYVKDKICARYPGVIIEVAYSQKRKNLERLAEDYLLDSNASVQVVIGLDIKHSRKGSRKATLLVWRTHVVCSADGNKLRVAQSVVHETFRNDEGNPTDRPGLQLQLTDFAYEELAHSELGNDNRELVVSMQQLCEYLDAAESMVGQPESLGEHSLAPGLKKRKRSERPPDQIPSSDEVMYAEQEERAAKRMAQEDSDYENSPFKSSSE